MKNILFALLPILLLTTACKEKEDQSEIDRQIILDYIDAHNLNAQSTASGLYYVIEKEGSGKSPGAKSDVQVIYKGYLTSGKVFDESPAAGSWFNLSQVIAGWREGIPLFMEGGQGKLLVPSSLGYGSKAVQGIPANSVMIFDITLKDVR